MIDQIKSKIIPVLIFVENPEVLKKRTFLANKNRHLISSLVLEIRRSCVHLFPVVISESEEILNLALDVGSGIIYSNSSQIEKNSPLTIFKKSNYFLEKNFENLILFSSFLPLFESEDFIEIYSSFLNSSKSSLIVKSKNVKICSIFEKINTNFHLSAFELELNCFREFKLQELKTTEDLFNLESKWKIQKDTLE